jgi:cytochrome P450
MQIIDSPSALELGSNPFQTLLELGAGRDAQRFPLGNRHLLLLNHPELLEWAFTNPALGRARFVRLFARFIGDGLITQDGEPHLMARRIMQKAFTRETLPGFMHAITIASVRELRTWHDGPSDLNTALTRVSQCATLQALFGFHEIPDQVATAALFSASSGMAMGMNVNLDGLERHNGRFRHALADQTMAFVMDHWQDTPVVQQLKQFEGQARIDQTFAVLVAGFETSAAGLVWLLELLLRHPEHLETVTQAVRECSDLIQQVRRLSSLRHAVQETLRLYPVAGWLNSRGGHAGADEFLVDAPRPSLL